MNYLAHALLASNDKSLIVGAFLGDHVRGKLNGRFPPRIEQGIKLHRSIDVFCDAHPKVVLSKSRLVKPYRRYAGVLIDMIHDQFLSVEWHRYHDQTLRAFADDCYANLDEHWTLLPNSLRRFACYMRDNDLLSRYGDPEVFQRALAGVSSRFSHANPVADALPVLNRVRTELLNDFECFFPDLQRFVLTQKAMQKESAS